MKSYLLHPFTLVYILLSYQIITVMTKQTYSLQFPKNLENYSLPSLLMLSIHSNMSLPHMKLLVESMKWNHMVQFTLIDVLPSYRINTSAIHPVQHFIDELGCSNIHLEVISYEQLSSRVNTKLGLSVSMDEQWSQKLKDYKPTLAYLFPEYIDENQYKYWGYSDIEIIWGNFTRFAYLFHGNKPIIVTDSYTGQGSVAFYANNLEMKSLFLTNKEYISLLKDKEYYNLDETGIKSYDGNILASPKPDQSMLSIQKSYLMSKGIAIQNGQDKYDRVYVTESDTYDWAGHFRWFLGSLATITAGKVWDFEHEILYYHRPSPYIDYEENMRSLIFDDMKMYGYILPEWIPVLSRFQCRKSGADSIISTTRAMDRYHPYRKECISQWTNVQRFVE